MTRSQKRLGMLLLLGAFGGYLIHLGFQGWVINRVIPAQYMGYLLLGFVVAGACGVNIWRGGPLDPRDDPDSGDQGA